MFYVILKTRKSNFAMSVNFITRTFHAAALAIIAERLSARHLILQHALGRCIFVRHAPLSLFSVTLCAKGWRGRDTRVGWMDGGGERVHARPNAWAFARALDGRQGYGETSPSTSARAIYCARHMYAHSADT